MRLRKPTFTLQRERNMTTKPVIALLPMKANSQRIPGKNFKSLGGKPLFRWILDTLVTLPEVEKVVINTDAERKVDLAGIDPKNKIVIRERAVDLRGDLVSMNRILENDLDHLQGDHFLMTHATNPFLKSTSISSAISAYFAALERGYDSLFSVNKIQSRFYQASGQPINHDPKNLVQTQDLEPWFEENSCLYIFSKDSFRASSARIGRKPYLYPTKREESLDIDNPEDWLMATLLVDHLGDRDA
jgi:CMP-N-acetylneuraminic acid synthetase